ncbi:nucleoside triphosphate pyrophosphohydrolase [Oceanicella actignis]|uniref:Nucleoside triphosphate pyrophosphohydrolase n=1 Tax=Oceanicella actignis TaxID=1189325 RepID=A0A1M7U032_9RHOB|nr:nucleoside triphosphate pyrophosphohydrolase [Oceanicella actignis]SET83948.1 ATP diphosphatase [Oceanicella actignis]SHN76339.1 ATP diphosphatase [Oceanicella actignis]
MSDRPHPARPLPRPLSDRLVNDPEGGLERLREIMRRLREPGHGCPWDLEQDHRSIAPYAIEEAHEVVDAIEREAWDELPAELGDLLFQAVFHAQMAEERGLFGLDDVLRAISDKMVRRHPHVFAAPDPARDAAAQTRAWEEMKARERAGAQHAPAGALDGLPRALPALTRAAKLQARAARVGFDWPDAGGVADKIAEEARELAEAAAASDPAAIEEEMGDLLFAAANLARRLDVDPETALRRACAKFERRFRAVERALAAQGLRPEEATLEQMDALWNAEKARERAASDRDGDGDGEGDGGARGG